jgi:hypothetical protein
VARDIWKALTGDDFLKAISRDQTFFPDFTGTLDAINAAITPALGHPIWQTVGTDNNTLRFLLVHAGETGEPTSIPGGHCAPNPC